MDARYIMDYTGFELMYEGIRHTTVEDHAEEWQLTTEQVETLKERLLEEENRVYKYWLNNLPHFACFEPDDEEDDEELHLFYDWDASDDNCLGADALTTNHTPHRAFFVGCVGALSSITQHVIPPSRFVPIY